MTNKPRPHAAAGRNPGLSGFAAARHRGVPAHDRPALRRPRKVDQGAGRGDALRHLHPAGDAEERLRRRSGDRRDLSRSARWRACCSCSSCPTAPSRCWSRAPRARPSSDYTDRSEYYEADATVLADDIGERVEAEAMARSVVTEFENYVKLNKKVSPEVVGVIQQIEDYAKLADTVASHLAVKIPDKQDILETPVVTERLEKVLGLMESEISVLQVEKRIRTRVKRQMEKTQREYYLNEQMKAIQKELGDEEGRDELQELEEKIKKTKLSKEAREKAHARAQEAAPDVADVGGSHGRAQLSRLAAVDPVEQEEQGQEGPAARREDPRRRSLRPGEGQGAHRRVSRRAAARQQADRPDPVPRRPARRRQDLARQVDRQARPAANSCACRSAACATRPRSAATGALISARCPARSSSRCARPRPRTRCSCSTRSTRWAPISAAIRPRRCSRCSIRSRTRPSTTTTSRSTTISPT